MTALPRKQPPAFREQMPRWAQSRHFAPWKLRCEKASGLFADGQATPQSIMRAAAAPGVERAGAEFAARTEFSLNGTRASHHLQGRIGPAVQMSARGLNGVQLVGNAPANVPSEMVAVRATGIPAIVRHADPIGIAVQTNCDFKGKSRSCLVRLDRTCSRRAQHHLHELRALVVVSIDVHPARSSETIGGRDCGAP